MATYHYLRDGTRVTVRHFLKDGTEVDDIQGRVVKYEDCPGVYHALDSINKRLAKERPIHKEGKQNAKHPDSNP